MNFEPAVRNSGMQPLGFQLNQPDHDYGKQLNHYDRHHSLAFQRPYPLGFNSSDVEGLTGIGYLQNHEGLINEGDVEPKQIEDLSAVVSKCNDKGFLNPCFSFQKVEESGLISCSQYSNGRINESHINCKIKPKRITPQIRSSGNGGSLSWRKESQILYERLRRSEMNDLFSKLRSLLPNPNAKCDKASIVSETINYIGFLKHRLQKHFKKEACRNLVEIPQSFIIPHNKRVLEKERSRSSFSNKSKTILCTKSGNENLTLNYTGKDIFITFNCVKKTNVLPAIILVAEMHKMEMIHTFVSHHNTGAFHFLHVKAPEILDPYERETLHGILIRLMKSELQIN